ncbi:MAG: DUF2142 domain-containing protein [Nitrospinota bacterium]|nr:DUF2142 domain-containing protein [Nitrospinota bacterium]
MSDKRTLLFSFLLVKSIVFAILIPPWLGNDEPNHFDYVLQLAGYGEGESNQEMIINSMTETNAWERAEMRKPPRMATLFRETAIGQHTEDISGTRPPLYYLLAALPLRIFHPETVETALLMCRFVSLIITMATLWMIFLTTSLVFDSKSDSFIPYLATLFAGMHPQISYQTVVVNADALAILVFTLVFYVLCAYIKRGKITYEEILILISVCTVGLLTKKHAVLLFPLVLAGITLILRGSTFKEYVIEVIKKIGFIAISVLAVAVFCEIMFPKAVIQIADRLGLALSFSYSTQDKLELLTLVKWIKGLGIIFVTFWFTYGQMIHKMSFGFYILLAIFSGGVIAGVAGKIRNSIVSDSRGEWQTPEMRVIYLCIVFISVIFISIFFTFFSPELVDRVSGRYLSYAIAPITIFAMFGINEFSRRATGFDLKKTVALFFISLNLVSLFGYLIPIYYFSLNAS